MIHKKRYLFIAELTNTPNFKFLDKYPVKACAILEYVYQNVIFDLADTMFSLCIYAFGEIYTFSLGMFGKHWR